MHACRDSQAHPRHASARIQERARAAGDRGACGRLTAEWTRQRRSILLFSMTERSDRPWIPEFGMGVKIHVIVRHDAPYFQVSLHILSLGYAGRFVCSIVRRVRAVSARRGTYTTEAGAARGQSGSGIPMRASARGVVHSTRNRST